MTGYEKLLLYWTPGCTGIGIVIIDYQPGSNARNLLEYAQRREKKGLIHIENLAGGIYENGTANTPLDTMSRL